MSIDLSRVTGISDSHGAITEIKDSLGRVIWAAVTGKPAVLRVEKITSDTYAGETTYTGEQFILLDIYPKTNGTVKVTYGGLTKTIKDTSGAAEPNAIQVFFGTFNGVSDSVATPASGELRITGDYYAFGCGGFKDAATAKEDSNKCVCITSIVDLGVITAIPVRAFADCDLTGGVITIPEGVQVISERAFCDTPIVYRTKSFTVIFPESLTEIVSYAFTGSSDIKGNSTVIYKLLGTTPPKINVSMTGSFALTVGSTATPDENVYFEVPKGCGATYKSDQNWSTYAKYIVEAT